MSESRQRREWNRISQHPRSVRFEELRRLLELSGYTLERVRGSHHVFGRGSSQIVIPLRRPHVLRVYVARVLELTTPEEGDEE